MTKEELLKGDLKTAIINYKEAVNKENSDVLSLFRKIFRLHYGSEVSDEMAWAYTIGACAALNYVLMLINEREKKASELIIALQQLIAEHGDKDKWKEVK